MPGAGGSEAAVGRFLQAVLSPQVGSPNAVRRWPAVALRLLLAAWLPACTPQLMAAGPAVLAPLLSEDAFTMADGARLPYRAWLPEGAPHAVILGVHGFGDYSVNAFDLGAPMLTAGGVALYAYDQRGFGAAPHRGFWPGTATLAADLTAATRLVRARHPGVPVFLLGESMGASVLLAAADGADPPPADGYLLLAPALRGRATMDGFMRGTLEVFYRIMPAVGLYASRPGNAPSNNPEALERWSRDPLTLKVTRIDAVRGLVDLMDAAEAALPRFTAPALVLYGARDPLVASDLVRRALRALPAGAPWRAVAYAEGHHLLLRDQGREEVARDILTWLRDPRAALPSGQEVLRPAVAGPGS